METIKIEFDKELLKQILDSFVKLTDIRAAFFENYVELVNGRDKNICKFCSIIRQETSLLAACINATRQPPLVFANATTSFFISGV